MKKLALPILMLCICPLAWAQTLLHYWNFNTTTTIPAHLTPNLSLISGAAISHSEGGISAVDLAGGTGQDFNLLNLNARNGDVSGNHLRFNDPIGGALLFSFPTTGYKDITIKYATRRSGSGAGNQLVSYSVNGTDYIAFDTIAPNNGAPTLQMLDFSTITTVNNNANFKIRIAFEQGSGGAVGNNRFDNLTVEGNSDGADVLAPSVSFYPISNAVNIPVTIQPTITFSEDVRLLDNVALDNTNVDTLVEVMYAVSEESVAFNATVSGRVITIVPNVPLINGKQYMIVVKGARIEDESNNMLAFSKSSYFTTIPVQTVLQPGDILLLAYQMNAVPNEDRIAFLTLADILPGTMIKFTDAKYVSTSPSQCPGGFTWTAPAGGLDSGAIVTIYNDAQTTDKGTLTGAGFGLTANGDQIIVYTGENTSPSYITSLSSNLWVGNNTDCGGSNSMLPIGLQDGATSINLSTTPGNVAGNTVNAYYNGPISGTEQQIKTAITNPANWIGSASGTFAQLWPTWAPGNTFATVKFEKGFVSVKEDTVSVKIKLLSTGASFGTVKIAVNGSPFSTTSNSDVNFSGASVSLLNGTNTYEITIPIVNDTEEEQDEYLILSLDSASGARIEGSKYLTLYIRDNDRKAKTPTKEVELSFVGSFKPMSTTGSTCEIVVHDPTTQRLFITSAVQGRLDIADFSNPAAITLIKSIDMIAYGGVTSVAVKNGVVAVASPNANEQLNGSVVFFDTEGTFLKQVTVGALPDMLTFSPDGKYVLTANEGQPNDAYTIDPEGSVSIIDISGGIAGLSQANVTTLLFDVFNAQESALIAAGVRKLKLTSTLSQDFEPEYLTVSADSKKAWVGIQESNAIAEINLETKTFISVWPLGTKDCSLFGNGFDASDNSGVVHLSNWPVKAFFLPDGMANYSVNGTTYVVTANEGDEKEYAGLEERTTVAAIKLDSIKFPQASVLKETHNLGRLRVTNLNGDTDNDGDFDELHMVGPRSFSIWNTSTKTLKYDSGDDFELFTSTSPSVAPIFNADNENNNFKSRSRAKGPEPEGVVLVTLGAKTFAFIGLERVGGIMVYDITDPTDVKLVDYKNSRSLTSFVGDHGPEGIISIKGSDSPNGTHYIAVANELSGTISVYELQKADILTALDASETDGEDVRLYPNPVKHQLQLSKTADVEVMNNLGQSVYEAKAVTSIDVSRYSKGLYILRLSSGVIKRFVVE